MPVIILCGLGETGKRNEIFSWLQKYPHNCIFRIDLKQESVGEIQRVLIGQSLFESGKRLVIAENVPDSFDVKDVLVKDHDTVLLLVAANPKKKSKLMESAADLKATMKNFEAEKELNVFPFLDQVLEGKNGALYEMERLLVDYDPIYLIAMLQYALRRNLLPAPQQSFIRQRINAQKARFKDSDWEKLYYLVLTSEYQVKSGAIDGKLGLTYLVEKIINGNFFEYRH